MTLINPNDEWWVSAQPTGECSIPECVCHDLAHSHDGKRQDQPPPPLWADAATVRAAVLDVLDNGWQCNGVCDIKHAWKFCPDDESELETVNRTRLADAVIQRLTQLQHPPHSYPRRPQEAA